MREAEDARREALKKNKETGEENKRLQKSVYDMKKEMEKVRREEKRNGISLC